MSVTKIPVNSIEIPARFVEIAKDWHDGQGDMMYAVASTGGVTARDCTEATYLDIWTALAASVSYCVTYGQPREPGFVSMLDFETFALDVVARLSESYGIK
jgi:hypothetical protein